MKKLVISFLFTMIIFSITACGKTIVNKNTTINNRTIKKTGDNQIDTTKTNINTDKNTNLQTLGLTYTNSKKNFKLNYPNNWHVEEGAFGAIVRFFPPQYENDKYREEIIVDRYTIKTGGNLKSYTEQAIALLQKGLTDFEKLNEKNIKINGIKSVKITFKGKRGKWNNQYQQVYILKEDKVYILTYTALDDTFDTYAEDFSKIIDSFQFIK